MSNCYALRISGKCREIGEIEDVFEAIPREVGFNLPAAAHIYLIHGHAVKLEDVDDMINSRDRKVRYIMRVFLESVKHE